MNLRRRMAKVGWCPWWATGGALEVIRESAGILPGGEQSRDLSGPWSYDPHAWFPPGAYVIPGKGPWWVTGGALEDIREGAGIMPGWSAIP